MNEGIFMWMEKDGIESCLLFFRYEIFKAEEAPLLEVLNC